MPFRYISLLLLALLSAFHSYGAAHRKAEEKPYRPYQSGDRFEYALYWSGIRVGSAVLSFDQTNLPEFETPLLRMRFTVRTSGLTNRLYRVDNALETYIDVENWRPLFHRKRQREGSRERDIEITFDWETGIASYRNLTDNSSRPDIELTEDTQDPLSLLGKIARSSSFEVGARFGIPATDGRDPAVMEAAIVAEEALTIPPGIFNTFKADVSTDELRGVFSKSPDAVIEVWFSADEFRVPLRMRSEVRVGSFYGELVDFRSSAVHSIQDLPSFEGLERRRLLRRSR